MKETMDLSWIPEDVSKMDLRLIRIQDGSIRIDNLINPDPNPIRIQFNPDPIQSRSKVTFLLINLNSDFAIEN